MKIRSIQELEDYISYEYAWRRKELTNLKHLISGSRTHAQELMIRSAIPLLYAHWEGIVKQISIAMLTYLVAKGLKYEELKESFLAYAILEKHQGQFPSKRFDALVNVFDKNWLIKSEPIRISPEKYIDTKSNLNSEVLRDITIKIGINYQLFELKKNLIDEIFLKVRNEICHGEKVSVSLVEFESLYVEVIILIDTFKNEVLNSVYQKSYLAP